MIDSDKSTVYQVKRTKETVFVMLSCVSYANDKTRMAGGFAGLYRGVKYEKNYSVISSYLTLVMWIVEV